MPKRPFVVVASGEFYVIPGAFDGASLAQNLGDLTVEFGPSTVTWSFTFLDCHDQSLRKSGRVLIENNGAMQLLQGDGQTFVQDTKGNGRFVQDLPDGPVRDALHGFPALRALTDIGGGELAVSTFAVLDDLQKTQVRGSLWHLSSEAGQAALVWLRPMRGYDHAFSAVGNALDGTADSDGIEAVFQGLFPGMVQYQAKPHIKLGKREPAIQAATDIICTYLSVARQNENGVTADIDTEFLHDYRVSLRRIRSVLSLFKGVFSEMQTAQLKQTFSDLMAPTGRMRDLDVYLLEKDMYFNLIPDSLHAGVQEMFGRFEKERAQELSRLSRRFRSAAYDKSMRNMAALFQDADRLQPGPNAERGAYDYACALIWKRYRKVCKLARSITEETPDEAVHALRIDCKKLRYLMEFFAPLFDRKSFKTIIKPLKNLQDNLGLFNDYAVQQDALREFISQQSNAQGRVNAQLAMAVGGLIAVLSQRQRAERDRVISNFQHFDGPDVQHQFRSLFHRKGD